MCTLFVFSTVIAVLAILTGQVAAVGVCYDNSTPFALATPTDANGVPMCALGYHCPNFNASDPSTYPQYCTPEPSCIIDRSFGEKCQPYGSQEPDVCPQGYYCPTATEVYECPEGHYCTYASYEPTKCPPLSICPAGSYQIIYLGGVLSSLCMIGLLIFLVITYRHCWRYTRLNTNFQEADRFISVVSARSNEFNISPAERPNTDSNEASPNTNSSTSFVPITSRKHAIDVLAGGFLRARNTKPLTYELNDMKVFVPYSEASSQKGADYSAEGRRKERLLKREDAKKGPMEGATDNRIPILQGVTATFAPARVTAILGPGGCGKSTLLNAVLGSLPSGWVREGHISVNGDSSLDVTRRLRPVTGSATQVEPLHRELTVFQNLNYNAQIRLPSDWTDEDRKFFLAATIEALQLTKQQDMPIGDEETRGISGGQRRRCHIGIEIASAPYSLFLDEPTNGLDSTTALEVCSCLSAIATGADLTVVMTISQPRVEIWNQLDDIIVIGKGGRTVYQGKREDAKEFFEDIYGVTFRPNGNPADIIVDAVAERGHELATRWAEYCANPTILPVRKQPALVSGIALTAAQAPSASTAPDAVAEDEENAQTMHALPDSVSVTASPAVRQETEAAAAFDEIIPATATHPIAPANHTNTTTSLPPRRTSPAASLSVAHLSSYEANTDCGGKESSLRSILTCKENEQVGAQNRRIRILRKRAPFFKQVYYIFHRSVSKQLSDLQPLIVEQVVNVIVAAVLGLSMNDYRPYWTFRYYKLLSPPENDLLSQIFMYLCMSFGIVCAMPSSGIFANERETYFREAKSGFSKAAYYIGVSLSLQPRIVMTAMIFTTLFQLIPTLAVDFSGLFFFVWLVSNCSYVVGAIPAMILPPASAPLVASLVCIVAACLSGFINFPFWLKYLSYGFWTSSFAQRKFQDPVSHAYEDMADQTDWISDNSSLCIGITFLILFIFHSLAYSLMVLTNRDKQR